VQQPAASSAIQPQAAPADLLAQMAQLQVVPVQFEWDGNFEFDAQVYLAGSFSGWQPIQMARQQSHVFSVVLGLPAGQYFYRFRVDLPSGSNWRTDTNKPAAIEPSLGQICNTLLIQ